MDVYDEIFQRDDEERARANVLNATRMPPQVARSRQVSRVTGLPTTVVDQDFAIYERDAYRRGVDDAIQRDPWLARYFRDRDNAEISLRDAQRLANIGNTLRPWTEQERNDFVNEVQGRPRNMSQVSRLAMQALLGTQPMPRMLQRPSEQPWSPPPAAARGARRPPAPSVPARDQFNNPLMNVRIGNWSLSRGVEGASLMFGRVGLRLLQGAYGLNEMASDLTGNEFQSAVSHGARGQIDDWIEAMTPDMAPWQRDVVGGLESGVQMLSFMAGGEFLTLGGLTGITTGEAYGRYRQRGAGVAAAATGGLAEGAIEYLTERIPLRFLFGKFGSTGARRFVVGYLGRELAGEEVATALQDAVDTAIANPNKTWEQYWEERPAAALSTAISTLTMTTIIGGAGVITSRMQPMVRESDDIAQGLAGQQFLDNLMAEAAESETRKLDPESFREMIQARTDGTPVQNVYVPVEVVDTYLQSEGAETDFFEPYQPQIEEARRLQGDVVIPIGEVLANLSGTPVWDAIREDVRVQPGGMSGREAKEKAKVFMQAIEERGAEIAAEAAGDAESMSSAVEVYEQVRKELVAAGRTEREADAIAQLVAARREAAGQRLNMTAAEYHRSNPIRFREAEPGEGPGENALLSREDSKPQNMAKLPGTSPGAFAPAVEASRAYMAAAGLTASPPRVYAPLDIERGSRIAEAFDQMEHAPNDPEVREAYDALVKETLAQWQAIKATGLKVEFIKGEDPYEGNPWAAVRDIRDNNHLWVFSTEDGYGTTGISKEERKINPMLAIVKGEKFGGRRVLVNDIFRVVHDYFGHAKEGVGFRAGGEENAWRIHSAMFSPLARRALTTETRGQNSWLNFGPFGEANRNARVEDTVFAEQKIGLLPQWVVEEGVGDVEQDTMPDAAWTAERISGLMDEHADAEGKSTAFAVVMSPDQFLGLTASPQLQELIAGEVETMDPFDEEMLGASNPIQLTIELGQHRNWVMSHDGRHRMTMLKEIGIQNVPVVLKVMNRKVSEDVESVVLFPQRNRNAAGEQETTVHKLIPITWANRDRLMEMSPQSRVMFQTGDGAIFYSALEHAIATSKTTRAPKEQWIATLRKAPGVKQEELEWSGLLDFLDMQEGPVERDRLLELLRGGGIVVDEVLLGVPGEDIRPEMIEARAQAFYDQYVDDRLDADPDADEDAIRQEANGRWGQFEDAAADELREQQPDSNAQFSSWSSDPSNPTYRELLLTLPIGRGVNPARAPQTHWDVESVVAHARFMVKKDVDGSDVLFIEEVQSDWHQKGRDEGYERVFTPEERAAADRAVEEAQDRLNEAYENLARDAVPLLQEWRKTFDQGAGTFAENLAMKFDYFALDVERVIALEGEDASVPFMWAQVGEAAKILLERTFMSEVPSIKPQMRALDEAHLKLSEAEQAASRRSEGFIPDAPFKTSWPALVMKRMIRWAADNGYDKIAWTTGEEQAERYNLSQAVGTLRVTKQDDGRYVVVPGAVGVARVLYDNGLAAEEIVGPNHSRRRVPVMTETQVRQAFGADLGSRIVDTMNTERNLSTNEEVEFKGEDLRIGGEGMKAFYDRNLVNITNDIIKRYGAKVSQQEVVVEQAPEAKLIKARFVAGKFGSDEALERAIAEARDPGSVNVPDTGFFYSASELRSFMLLAKQGAIGEPHPGFTLTPELKQAAQQGFALFQNDGRVRGQAQFGRDPGAVITLFADANLSTLIHELGHVFLEEMFRDARAKGAPTELKEDVAKLSNWFAANGHAVRRGQIPTAAHELFARGFERYAMEGKPPSEALRGPFAQFRAWLLRIYQVVENLKAPINTEVREVMGRMLATEGAIIANTDSATPLFKSAEEAQMTEAEFAAYTESIRGARDEAYDALLYRTMEAIRRRETQRIRDQRANVRSEVAADINSRPEFIALHLLRTGRWLGDPEREATKVKLNSGWLIDNYGEDIFARLPRGLPITAADGLDGDVVAEMVGLPSGDQLVRTLIAMRESSEQLKAAGEKRTVRDVLIDKEVDRIMAERHGDPLTDGSIEEEAIAAINSARQGEIIAGEMRQLAKRKAVLGGPTPYQVAREWARRTITNGRVVDVASRAAVQRYTRATVKAARLAEAAILAEDAAEAFRQKQAQLLNHALLAEAKIAADKVETMVARMKRLANQAGRKSVDPAYFERIHELLARFDFRPVSQKALDEKESFETWAAKRTAEGYEVVVPPRLEGGQHFSRIPVHQLYDLNDAIESLLSLGRLKQSIRDQQEERQFTEFRDDILAHLERLPERKQTPSPAEDESRLVASAVAPLLKIETIADEMDAQDPNGPMNRLLVQRASQAAIERDQLSEKALVPIAKLFLAMPRKMRKAMHDRVTATRLTWNTVREGDSRAGSPVTMTRMEWIGVALNTGNLSNLEKMSKGERWPAAAIQQELNHILTKEEWDFVQSVWDNVAALWPEIVRVERELSGVAPEQVESLDVETPFGPYKGGYFPVVYDVNRSQRAENNADNEADDLFGAKSGIGTPKGHTITRTEAIGPLSYRVEEILVNHIERVTTRIAYAVWIRDVIRTIDNPKVRGMIDSKLGAEYRRQIRPWLRRQVTTHLDRRGSGWWDRLLRQFRVNLSISAMGFAYSTGVAQTLGLSFSAGRIGAVYVGKGLKQMIDPRTGWARAQEFVFSRSPEMERRGRELNREVVEVFHALRGKHGWYTNAQAMAFWHIAMIDRYMVAMPTWLGAFQKAIDEGMEDKEASAYADKIVRNSQGSGREKDLAAIQSPNSEAMKFFTMFYTPFNVMFNAQWDAVRSAKRGDWRTAMQISVYFMVVTALADAMQSGDWPDEVSFEDLLSWFGRNVFFGLFGGIPVARDGANFIERKINDQYSNLESPVTSLIEDGVKTANQTYDIAFEDKEVTGAWIKSTSRTLGAALGLPGGQAGKTGGFLWDVYTGETEPEGVRDWYTGVTSGKVRADTEE